jgi:HTH-type transcriptional regulator / antitoxin HigA
MRREPSVEVKLKIFMDTSALFAAVHSETGGSRLILKLGEAGAISLWIGTWVLKEMERVLDLNIWSSVSQILYIPRSEKEYEETVALLDSLIDEVGEDENHPLASFMEILGVLIEKYEDEFVPEI